MMIDEVEAVQLAESKIAKAAEVGRWLGTKQSANVPISGRLDVLLDELDQGCPIERKQDVQAQPKQLYIHDKVVTLSDADLAGLMNLKQLYWLLTHFRDSGKRIECIHSAICPSTGTSASPMERLKQLMQRSAILDSDFDNPSSLPEVHVLELILLSDEIQDMIDSYHRVNPELDRDLLEQHYISTGTEELSPTLDQGAGSGALSQDIDSLTENYFDIAEEQSFAKYLAEVSKVEHGSYPAIAEDTGQSSLVDVIAADAQANISVMKLDVDAALRDTHSSEVHLINYKDFIEKKRKQRIQCLRDIQIHCCTCRGPHVSKPPFSHGKDYRREPTHAQHQGNKCIFLKKKRAELKWLDETLGNYCKNNERFEREIEKRKAETRSRKENMKEALANSLRLMEICLDESFSADSLTST